MTFHHAPGLRLRPVPELGMCLAFTPSPPRLHTLNPAAWLILELCDGNDESALRPEFLRRCAPPLATNDALKQLEDGLSLLQRTGILLSSNNNEVQT